MHTKSISGTPEAAACRLEALVSAMKLASTLASDELLYTLIERGLASREQIAAFTSLLGEITAQIEHRWDQDPIRIALPVVSYKEADAIHIARAELSNALRALAKHLPATNNAPTFAGLEEDPMKIGLRELRMLDEDRPISSPAHVPSDRFGAGIPDSEMNFSGSVRIPGK